jgi:predicted nucleotide-binding protein
MVRKRSDTVSAPHIPEISPALALKKMQKLLEQISEIRRQGHNSAAAATWQRDLKIVLAEFYGENSHILRTFNGIWFSPGAYYDGQPESDFINAFNSGMEEAEGFLKSRVEDLQERAQHNVIDPTKPAITSQLDSRKIFVVHGHNHGTKETVARFLGKLDLEPIILHEQPDRGKTLIEKFMSHAEDVLVAVVILTADDIASSKIKPEERESRARQNVVFELGFFVGKLGRDHTFALVEKGVTLPSDIHGVVYISLDDGEWRLRLVRELKAAGLEIDANRAL